MGSFFSLAGSLKAKVSAGAGCCTFSAVALGLKSSTDHPVILAKQAKKGRRWAISLAALALKAEKAG